MMRAGKRITMIAAAISLAGLAVAREDDHGDHHHGHDAHEHGVAELTIAVDGAVVEIELDSPAMNLVGFERRPHSDAERDTLDAAVTSLRDGGRMFAFEPADAGCVLKRVTVLSALLDDDEEEEGHHDDHDGHHDDHQDDDHDHHDHDHADMFAAWRFECAGRPVTGVDTGGLFSRFPGTERLRAQAATSRGQTVRELTAASSWLRW